MRRLRPVPADVALGVDVRRRGRPAGAVQVVGDRLAAEAAIGPQVEDLGHHLGPVGIGHETRLDLHPPWPGRRPGGGTSRRGTVGRPATAAEALQRPLAHPALGLAGELLTLVLVDGLLQGDHETALGGRRVACADRVVDVRPAASEWRGYRLKRTSGRVGFRRRAHRRHEPPALHNRLRPVPEAPDAASEARHVCAKTPDGGTESAPRPGDGGGRGGCSRLKCPRTRRHVCPDQPVHTHRDCPHLAPARSPAGLLVPSGAVLTTLKA